MKCNDKLQQVKMSIQKNGENVHETKGKKILALTLAASMIFQQLGKDSLLQI